jgi:hypothetical protein
LLLCATYSTLAYYRLVSIAKGIEPYGWNRSRNFFQPKAECYLSQKISEVIGPEAREILIQAITNGSVVSWQHINLLGEYDFSDEKLQDSAGIKPPKLAA